MNKIVLALLGSAFAGASTLVYDNYTKDVEEREQYKVFIKEYLESHSTNEEEKKLWKLGTDKDIEELEKPIIIGETQCPAPEDASTTCPTNKFPMP